MVTIKMKLMVEHTPALSTLTTDKKTNIGNLATRSVKLSEKLIRNFRLQNLKGRELGKPRKRQKDNIKMDLQETGCEVWVSFIWIRRETSGRHLHTR
jgi:hypothetical protein